MVQEYFEINKKLWNAKVGVHLNTELYDMEAFMAGASSLDEATLKLLGEVHAKDVLHLQCHFGQDSLSIARMGARVVGVDLSNVAVEKARELNDTLQLDAQFVECNVYDAKEHVEGTYDIVFASFGTIVWLPDLDKWADVVQHFLKPGGKLVFLDFHPVLDMINWDTTAFEYDYFNPGKPYVETNQGTYADKNADMSMAECFWTHSMAEVVQALLNAGLKLETMEEYDYSPYGIFGEMTKRKNKEFVMKKIPVAFPYFYGLVCRKV